jgi:aspartyl/asparaginyl-tRNA synthetase|tara:strand:+ start:189 stop:1067 length:879 start_codon:yes stop_codon:yes gene_type:complete
MKQSIINFLTTNVVKKKMINTKDYNSLVQKLREFFLQKGFLEVPVQSRLSILAACEDPFTVEQFNWANEVWPLPQTGQMWLEYELLKTPDVPGVFCISTSYRNEPNPIPGRHETIFPMFEFESKGNMGDLIKMESELLQYLELPLPTLHDYEKLAKEYGVDILETEHEQKMCEKYGEATIIQHFPERTSPFWNMRHKGDGIFNKVDVILYGQETIGSAERATDKVEMRNMFETISDGGYKEKLYDLFGKDRVEKELDEYFDNDFFPRFGGGIGVTRLIRALKMREKELELTL